MAVAMRADVTGAVLAFLQTQPAITALTSTRISARRQPSWNLPAYAVLIQGRRGGGEDGPLHWQRFDITCYGPDDRTADLLWRTLDYAFCPEVGGPRRNGFTAASTSVAKVEREGGPIGLTDPDTTWDYVLATYRVWFAPDALA
jgi:hypothetical protein